MRRCLLLLVAALALALPLQQCAAHICLFSPVQRGEMVLDDPGHPSCAHKGPAVCGGVAPGKPTASYVAGLPATVQFQQNLNHFYGQTHAASGWACGVQVEFFFFRAFSCSP
jgi:hypothetical protein